MREIEERQCYCPSCGIRYRFSVREAYPLYESSYIVVCSRCGHEALVHRGKIHWMPVKDASPLGGR